MRIHLEGLVVLLDLMMPGMDGQAVLQSVAEEAPLAKRHASLLMNAKGKTLLLQVRDRLPQPRVTLVSKPFDLDVLLASIAKAARGLQEERVLRGSLIAQRFSDRRVGTFSTARDHRVAYRCRKAKQEGKK